MKFPELEFFLSYSSFSLLVSISMLYASDNQQIKKNHEEKELNPVLHNNTLILNISDRRR